MTAAAAVITPAPARSTLGAWLANDVARTQDRLDRLARVERAERDRSAARAGLCWDEDRRSLAEDLGARLAKDPARVVKKLRATPQGCDWVLERWGLLLDIAEAGQPWNDGQANLALDLLGTPADLREPATVARRLADPAGVARAEIAAVRDRKARVTESDAQARTLAIGNLAEPTSPEFREIRRHEAGLHRRLRWSLAMLDLIPEVAAPHAEPPAPGKPEPGEIPPPPRVAAATVALAPTPAMTSVPRSHRPDPAKLRARLRHEARQRSQARPDR